MIKLTFRSNEEFICSFELDERGEVGNVVGDDSWFDYDYQTEGIDRSHPDVWVDLIKKEYRGTGIDVLVLKEPSRQNKPSKYAFLLAAVALILIAFFLIPLIQTGPPSGLVVSKSRDAFLRQFQKSQIGFSIKYDNVSFFGQSKRGVVSIGEKTWGPVYVRSGQFERPINSTNSLPLYLKKTVLALLPKNIKFKSKSKKSILKDEYLVQGSPKNQSGLIGPESDYKLIASDKYLPLKITIKNPSPPYRQLIKGALEIEFRYP